MRPNKLVAKKQKNEYKLATDTAFLMMKRNLLNGSQITLRHFFRPLMYFLVHLSYMYGNSVVIMLSSPQSRRDDVSTVKPK